MRDQAVKAAAAYIDAVPGEAVTFHVMVNAALACDRLVREMPRGKASDFEFHFMQEVRRLW